MRQLRSAVLTVLGTALVMVAPAAPAAADSTTYTFTLLGPNTAVAPAGPHAGDSIRVTGSGTFNPAAGTIVAGGSFTHLSADGTVHERGWWRATALTSFTGFGGPSPGRQGGVLWLVVTHFHQGGAPHEGIPMSVTSTVNAPPGLVEGTTVGEFTVKTGGRVRFHLAACPRSAQGG